MGSLSRVQFPERHALENLWRDRMQNARLQLDSAHTRLSALQRATSGTPSLDGNFTYQQAIRAMNLALEEYCRVLQLFTELVVEGTTPNEGEWLRSKPR